MKCAQCGLGEAQDNSQFCSQYCFEIAASLAAISRPYSLQSPDEGRRAQTVDQRLQRIEEKLDRLLAQRLQ